MRPRKQVLLYHPNEDAAALLRYAMELTLMIRVHVAKIPDEIPSPKINVTARWTAEAIEIRNLGADTFRTVPLDCSNLDLMEAMRNGLARRARSNRGVHKDREEKQAAVLVTRVRAVTKEIDRVERMMEIVLPAKKRRAA